MEYLKLVKEKEVPIRRFLVWFIFYLAGSRFSHSQEFLINYLVKVHRLPILNLKVINPCTDTSFKKRSRADALEPSNTL